MLKNIKKVYLKLSFVEIVSYKSVIIIKFLRIRIYRFMSLVKSLQFNYLYEHF